MDLTGLSLVITASVAALTASITALAKAWRASVQRAATELQVKATLIAKDREIEELKIENAKLWELATRPNR